jgi:phosphatidate cytidylyltransferase
MLKHRIITALVLLTLFLLALFVLPDAGWVTLVIVIVLQGASEWTRLAKLDSSQSKTYWWLTFAFMIGLVWFDANFSADRQLPLHLAVYIIAALLWLAIVPVWLLSGWKVERPLLMSLLGWAVLIPTGLAMIDLRAANPWVLLGMMCLVWVADIAAYFSGRHFGKNKLAPSISPGKTWEGVAGAIAGVSLYIATAWSFSPYAGQHVLLLILLVASWCWVALAVIGDLFESAIKRQAGVKDSGAMLPGHGGLLDRIDALTSTLPLAALMLLLQHIK